MNPFSTRCVRPGAIAYCFPEGLDVASLVERLRENGWRGQIVGPHGSGKSTLLAALGPAIEQAGKRIVTVALHDGQRRLPLVLKETPGLDASAVLVVDGYEQLSWRGRFGVKRFCARRGVGLLVTAHAPVGLPDLLITSTDATVTRRIVQRLLGDDPTPIAPEEVDAALARHQGDLRETLFTLYDLYESRRS